MRVEDLLIRRKDNEKVAVVHGTSRLSYRQLFEQTHDFATEIKEDDSLNVVLFASNSIEYIIGYFATLMRGRVVVPVNSEVTEDELINIILYSDTNLLITTRDKLDYCMDVLSKRKLDIRVLTIENSARSVEFDEKNAIYKKNKTDVAIMLQTSGTSSRPKRVMLTHNNLICNVKSNVENLCLSCDDVFLVDIPLCFGYCNTAMLLTSVFLGATLVIANHVFSVRSFWSDVETNNVTVFTCVPTLLYILGNNNYEVNNDISSLRYICFGGAKTDCDLLRKLIKKYPSIGFVQTYGLTEASPRVTSLLPEESLRKMGSVGKPIPNVNVNVVDADGKVVAPGVDGEIVVSGPNVMKGYYKCEEITKETIVNQWLHTGDRGHFDDEGYLYITGRIKNIIITNGINVYPEEVEEIMMQYPGIKAVRVYGKEDSIYGEIVVADVVSEHQNTQEDIIIWCKNKLSPYKVPNKIFFVNSIRRTYNGKIMRFREEVNNEHIR